MIHLALCAEKVCRSILLLWCASVALSGCGVQFFYNNLDAFVASALADYIELTPEQETLFEREFEALWRWHRREELPRYASDLERINDVVGRGVEPADFEQAFDTTQGWWQRIEIAGEPAAKRFIKSLDDAQVDLIPDSFEKENERREKRAARRSREDRQDGWRKNFRRIIERFTGALNREQKAMLADGALEYRPESKLWGEYRLRWQAEFLALLKARHDEAIFDAQYEAVFGPQHRFYSQALIKSEAHNQALTKHVLLSVLDSLSDEQVARLQSRLNDYAEDLRELSRS